jgi:hypothetical protein
MLVNVREHYSNFRERRAKAARAGLVEAYGIARASWMRRFGLPTHAEDNLLRACYSIGDTSADEWAMLEYLRAGFRPRPSRLRRVTRP